MDPLRTLLEYLQDQLQNRIPRESLEALESTVRELFAHFELVPKHEYEAQLAILSSLEAQVASLETRLNALEEDA